MRVGEYICSVNGKKKKNAGRRRGSMFVNYY